jgi:hypothetical protein
MNAQALQLLISVGGITLMVGLCAALFGRAGKPLSDASAAAESLARDVPGFHAGRMALSHDARSALIEDARDGAIYLAVVRGDGLVTRKLGRDALGGRDGDRLMLNLRDFTLRKADLELADAASWEAALKGVTA